MLHHQSSCSWAFADPRAELVPVFHEILQHCWWEGFPLAPPGSGQLWGELWRAAGKQERAGWEEVGEFSCGMEVVSPTPSMQFPALSGVGQERKALQLGGCEGKEEDRAQRGWAKPPVARPQDSGDQWEPLRHPRFYVDCSSCKAWFIRPWPGVGGAGGKFTIHRTWLRASINISMSTSNFIVPLACGEAFPLKALKRWVLLF